MTLTPGVIILTALIGAIASAINAVAGGGSLISFPYLTAGLRLDSVTANVTNTVSLWPGSIAGGLGFREHLHRTAHHLKTLSAPTILGSILGAFLLLNTPKGVFDALVPVLILVAVICLWMQPKVKALAAAHSQGRNRVLPGIIVQFFVSVYGGYFGAGMGIMMLAAFAITMDEDLHAMNAVKNWLGMLINLVASICFFSSNKVIWPLAITLTVGSIIGGFLGARLSQKVAVDKLRFGIVVYGLVMVLWFLYRFWSQSHLITPTK